MKHHIMLPKSTLREFTVNNRLHCLDLKENVIKISSARAFNTIENYYPNETEDFLSKVVETQIGKMRKQLKDYELGLVDITVTPALTELLINIFIIQSMRVPDLSRYVYKNSDYANVLGIPERFYSALHHNINTLQYFINNAYRDVTASILNAYSTNVIEIHNDIRERSFVLPSSHFIGFGRYLMLVLTPYWGITLIPESENKQLLHEGSLLPKVVIDNEILDQINLQAAKYENTLSLPRLVGLPSELERVRQKKGISLFQTPG